MKAEDGAKHGRADSRQASGDVGRTRRDFLYWLGVAPTAAAALVATGSLACAEDAAAGGPAPRGVGDAGSDGDGWADGESADTPVSGASDAGDDQGDGLASGDDADPEMVGDLREGAACELTGSDVEGPFHVDDAPFRTRLAADEEPGERLVIEGIVYGPDCRTALEGALLDVWQADAEGNYHDEGSDYRLRGQVLTNGEGRFVLETIRPGNYPLAGSVRPAHIHFMVSAPSHRPLTTQLYFRGDPHLAPADPCTTCNSGDPTLIIDLEREGGDRRWRGYFEVVLDRV